MKNKKWVHLIGICGVTMAPLANMFKELGWFVSGSDKGIFPPMSDYLEDRDINIELGFKTKYLTKEHYKDEKSSISEYPDLVVMGNYATLKNDEYVFAKDKELNILSYPEVLSKYLVKSNSIVIAGTYGKTTSSALLSLMFEKAGKNPSYMIGGLAKNFENGIKNTDSEWSIIEGDEYISARFDKKSKFFHYSPEFLLLTAASWEHTDIFKTVQDYIDNFKKLVRKIPPNGIIVAAKKGDNVEEVLREARCKVVTYELNKIDDELVDSDWFNLSHKENSKKGEIVLYNKHTKEEVELTTDLIGDHNRENIIGCSVLARELDIDKEAIIDGVKDFKGIKRRLEVRYKEENLKIIDDHACSPPKVLGSLGALRQTYPDWHITVVFEPNVGNRTKESLPLFKEVFEQADEVVIPHLKPVKTKSGVRRTTGNQLYKFLKEQEINTTYIGDDDKLVEYVSGKDVGKSIICFMGAYSFRRMIEQVIDNFN